MTAIQTTTKIRPSLALKRCNALTVAAKAKFGNDGLVERFLNRTDAFNAGIFKGKSPAGAAMESQQGLIVALDFLNK